MASTTVWVLGTIVVYLCYKLVPIIFEIFNSGLRNIPGPPTRNLLFGHIAEMRKGRLGEFSEKCLNEYGHVVRVKGFAYYDRLVTIDPKALNHILVHSADYPKPDMTRRIVANLFGEGLLVAEGEVHRRQRRLLNPAFGPVQIRELTDIFVHKSLQLRDIWMSSLPGHGGPTRINVHGGLTPATLDIIGLAGFDHDFNALNPTGKPSELSQALTNLMAVNTGMTVLGILENTIFPFLSYLPTKRNRMRNQALNDMKRIGREIVEEKKAAILKRSKAEKTGHAILKEDFASRDLISLLIRANMATDIPENQRLTDEEVIAQIPTFFIAGHETTSSAVSWALYALSIDPRIQTKLRDELFSLSTDTPTMDELNSLSYLDMVLRETLRLHAPVAGTLRQAGKDDIIPLEKPYTDVNGVVQHSIRVKAGDRINIPILQVNISKDIWGEDSYEFKPERWEKIPDAATSIPGVWGDILTFIGGPRACIGYRFSLVESKALLYTIVRAFEFELAVPVEDIEKKASLVTRPKVKSEPEGGFQLPLLVKSYAAQSEA
ncbi:cytochrome P450 [Abortiporus biennis]|nr:cytochrome P450 [Abortiporus biennis]